MATPTRPQTAPRLVTWDDFLQLDDDDRRELLDGRLVEGEVTTRQHEHIVAVLIGLLSQWSWEAGGRVLASRYKVRIHEHRGVMPDLQYFRPGNFPGPAQEQGLAEGRPDVAVEVVSPGSRRYDAVRKRADYAAIGVPEYWLVDPKRRTLTRFVLGEGDYAVAEERSGGEVFRPDGFDGLEVPLARLWI